MNLTYREFTLKDIDKLKKIGLTLYGQFKKELTMDNCRKMSNLDSYTDLLNNCLTNSTLE